LVAALAASLGATWVLPAVLGAAGISGLPDDVGIALLGGEACWARVGVVDATDAFMPNLVFPIPA
jgi:hypothetical protein